MKSTSHPLKSLLGVLCAVFPLVLIAPAVQAAQKGWTSNSTIVTLAVTGDGGVNVRLSPELEGCVSNYGYGPTFASIYPSHPGINRMKADLLAAYLTGRTVALYLIDGTCRVDELILGGW